ncbi:hypothetical protein D3C71_849060 [compost metagenome]
MGAQSVHAKFHILFTSVGVLADQLAFVIRAVTRRPLNRVAAVGHQNLRDTGNTAVLFHGFLHLRQERRRDGVAALFRARHALSASLLQHLALFRGQFGRAMTHEPDEGQGTLFVGTALASGCCGFRCQLASVVLDEALLGIAQLFFALDFLVQLLQVGLHPVPFRALLVAPGGFTLGVVERAHFSSDLRTFLLQFCKGHIDSDLN